MSAPAPPPPPSPPPPPPPITRLEPDRVRAETFTALRAGAVLARAEAGVVSLVGPGAVTCLQGLLTSDVEKPGDGAFVYGALLTPKGMIVVDGWAARRGAAVRAKLAAAGAADTDPTGLELARILAGWPGLASEVDEKTIPQEVRYDEIGGVSYTKGCYTGQETVSRLHFRGHTNRYLRGLMFDAGPAATPAPGWTTVTHLDRDVGRVTSLAWVPEAGVAGGGLWIGLALVRREVLPGTAVRAAGRDAHVVELPFALPVNEPA